MQPLHVSVVALLSSHWSLATPPGFLGEGDVVTQAIHDAQLLLRSHGSAGGREREKERERDGGGKMVRGFSSFVF